MRKSRSGSVRRDLKWEKDRCVIQVSQKKCHFIFDHNSRFPWRRCAQISHFCRTLRGVTFFRTQCTMNWPSCMFEYEKIVDTMTESRRFISIVSLMTSHRLLKLFAILNKSEHRNCTTRPACDVIAVSNGIHSEPPNQPVTPDATHPWKLEMGSSR